ncbi:MAG: TrkH family potassium uptake protein [Spirochaetaceae bacterium]|nr:TrkH family potassium uptake protein [Spirochaetaceae bacterium]
MLFILLILGIAGLYLEQQIDKLGEFDWIVSVIDLTLVFFLVSEALLSFLKVPNKKYFLKTNIPSLIFLVIYLFLFLVNRLSHFIHPGSFFRGYFFLVVVRNILLILKVYGRIRKFTGYLNSIFSKPAQTVVLSFIVVILVGTLLIMMPFMTVDGYISPINALFTVTSAVCVTGLIVVDTAVYFTLIGQITLLVLIQIGGLGIMLLSYFMVFSFRRSLSLKDRTLLSFMLNESDLKAIVKSVKRIIILTFSIELTGALILFPLFLSEGYPPGPSIFNALFHAISAFCNAGFALFSNSLESFRGNYLLNFTIAGLIIAGGISFSVLTELVTGIRDIFRKRKTVLSINTKVVVQVSAILTVAAMLVIYKLEHRTNLYILPLGEQYLSAFFQAVTLRTAGFNTLSFTSLRTGTLMMMIGIMFIGGASGSTAGGIKVNTLGVVWAYIQSFRKGKDDTLIYRHQVSKDQILQAFTVIIFGIISVFTITFILIVIEDFPPVEILFESVSAFATVGLSTGITGSFTTLGKFCLIILMFFGRIGPLTLLTASSKGEKSSQISYPEATLLIG